MAEYICKVVGPECTHPAGWQTGLGYAGAHDNTRLRTSCYVCGEAVCKKDSRLMPWYGSTCRVCDWCREDEERCEAEALGAIKRRTEQLAAPVSDPDARKLTELAVQFTVVSGDHEAEAAVLREALSIALTRWPDVEAAFAARSRA